jgi:hypothetical protein
MKPDLELLVREAADPLIARNRVREVLQAKILGALQRSGAMIPLAFHGGTALRFLYSLNRFSEDLDFALERPTGYNFQGFLKAIQRDLRRERYEVRLKVNDKKVVHKAFVHFPGLLYELGLPAQPTENLSIKIEVDTKPPEGAVLETTLVRRDETLRLQHHDRATLLAGKLHAVLQRSYTKGRDLFDLIWYLSDPDWPSPNLQMLNNALRQSGWKGDSLKEGTWPKTVSERLLELDWHRAVADLQPFVSSAVALETVTMENIQKLLRGVGRE